MSKTEFSHYSVMLHESVDALEVKENGIYLDCTLGGCGHTKEILSRADNVKVIGIDRDADAIENAKNTLKNKNFFPVKANFVDAASVLDDMGIDKIDGAVMDLGVSSYQLDNAERGFSYMHDAKLDMRMDTSAELSAYNVVNEYPKEELIRILSEYGEERYSKRIAERICCARSREPIVSTLALAQLVADAVPKGGHDGHPAKRTFQAIRIEVNSELEIISRAINSITDRLKPGGRIAVITFHSLEDRIVKNTFAKLVNPCTCPKDFPICVCGKKPVVKLVNRKPILPSDDENKENSRSHSAKLRAAEKL